MKEDENTLRKPASWNQAFGTEQAEKSPFYRLHMQHMKQAEWINFVLKSGVQEAFALMGLTQISYFPDEGILLVFRHATVKVKGRRMTELHKHLLMRKVSEVSEVGAKLEHELEETELFVSGIEIQGDYTVH